MTKHTRVGWKLFRVTKQGPKSLFINRTHALPINQWMPAGMHPTKGFAVRRGWHVMLQPIAPHLSMRGRVWRRVEVRGRIQEIHRPASQGGTWLIASQMRIVP